MSAGTSVKLPSPAGAGAPESRQSTVTAIPRVTAQSGLKVVALVPLIRPAATASSTAWLYQLPAGTSVKAAWAAPAGTASARASVSPHTARSAPAFDCTAASHLLTVSLAAFQRICL